jgi:hypothetical protein
LLIKWWSPPFKEEAEIFQSGSTFVLCRDKAARCLIRCLIQKVLTFTKPHLQAVMAVHFRLLYTSVFNLPI